MRKLYALLLALVLVFSFTATALAAEPTAPLTGSLVEQDGAMVLTLKAEEDTVSGTITVFYDGEKLTFKEVKVDGTLTSLTEGDGFVTLGYAVSTTEAFSRGDTVAELIFEGSGETLMDIRVENFNENNNPNQYLPVVTNPQGMTRFKDVSRNAWYYDAVEYSAQRGWVNGVGNDLFMPEGNLNRAMFVTILGRMEGVQAGDFPVSGFADVDEDAYYAPYVSWAAETGITTGMNETEFDPNGLVTREQAATFMYRYAGYKGLDTDSADKTLKTFSDHTAVSTWATDAMIWATDCGLFIGTGGKLAPRATMTRAQAVTVLQRMDVWLS